MTDRLPELPPGTRRLTEAEERWLAESARWSRTAVSTQHSAWAAEPELRCIILPGRELWVTPAEWDALAGWFRANREDGNREH